MNNNACFTVVEKEKSRRFVNRLLMRLGLFEPGYDFGGFYPDNGHLHLVSKNGKETLVNYKCIESVWLGILEKRLFYIRMSSGEVVVIKTADGKELRDMVTDCINDNYGGLSFKIISSGFEDYTDPVSFIRRDADAV